MTGEPISYPLAERLHHIRETDPDRLAIIGAGTRLTYRELAERCDRWSRSLTELADADRIVAPVHGLDPWGASVLVAAVLAGVRVCPLDVDDPPDRIERLRSALDAVRIGPDELEQPVAERARTAETTDPLVVNDIVPRVIAFTSGTTSEPKALEVPAVRWHRRHEAFTDELDAQRCRLMAASPGTYGFLVGVLDSILLGSTAVMFDLRRGTARGLVDVLHRHDVTFISLTPSLARELARLDDRPDLTAVSLVEIRGERSTGDDLRAIHSVFPAAEVRHLYGAIEATRIAVWRWRRGDPVPDGTLPAGAVEPGVRIRLVDGELWVNSADSIEEYLVSTAAGADAPDPAEKFVREGTSTWIRTGDRVTIEAGMLHVHGRIDGLRKVGGLYVDLADVARHITAHDGVGLAEVTSYEDGGTRLVAHVVPTPRGDLTPRSLRAALARHLPLYMIPGTIRIIPELPLNASAKVDRRALEAWRPDPVDRSDAPWSPLRTSALGASICTFAESRLGRTVLPEDDLLAAGLDSLGWVELASHIEESTAVRLAFTDIVEHPTAEGIVESVRRSSPEVQRRPWVRLRSGGRSRILWLANGWAVSEAMDPARHCDGHELIVVASEPDDRGNGDPISVRAVRDTALAVIDEIGPFDVVVGVSTTCYAAMSLARSLAARDAAPALLVLLDPPGLLPLTGVSAANAARHLQARIVIRRQATTSRWRSRSWRYADLSLMERHSHGFRRRRLALIRHRPRPYDGPTLAFTSDSTGRDGTAPNSFDRRLLTGPVTWEHLHVAHPLVPHQGREIIAAIDAAMTRHRST